VLTLGFRDSSGVWRYYDSSTGVVTVGGRLNVIATYDGVQLKLYVNGYLHKEFDQTGNIFDSSNVVYLGTFLKGVLSEVMLWNRCLVDQEVLELYFFPLLRLVKKGSVGNSPVVVPPFSYIVTNVEDGFLLNEEKVHFADAILFDDPNRMLEDCSAIAGAMYAEAATRTEIVVIKNP
jgi:hypothetical protein